MPLSVDEMIALLKEGGVGFASTFDMVGVVGADAATFLHGQLSQDIEGMGVDSTRWSMILEPKGHLVGWHRITRTAEERFFLLMDPGVGESVLARLERFKLRTDVRLSLNEVQAVSVRGLSTVPWDPADRVMACAFDWAELRGYDLIGNARSWPLGVTEIDPGQAEWLRIEYGVPRAGRELAGRVLPASVGLTESSASFTKGCYVGQELVARMASRAAEAPLRLTRFTLSAEPEGATDLVTEAGAVAGELTSVAPDGRGGAVALGFVQRSASGEATLLVAGTSIVAAVRP